MSATEEIWEPTNLPLESKVEVIGKQSESILHTNYKCNIPITDSENNLHFMPGEVCKIRYLIYKNHNKNGIIESGIEVSKMNKPASIIISLEAFEVCFNPYH